MLQSRAAGAQSGVPPHQSPCAAEGGRSGRLQDSRTAGQGARLADLVCMITEVNTWYAGACDGAAHEATDRQQHATLVCLLLFSQTCARPVALMVPGQPVQRVAYSGPWLSHEIFQQILPYKEEQ